jgi:hypothetical protein
MMKSKFSILNSQFLILLICASCQTEVIVSDPDRGPIKTAGQVYTVNNAEFGIHSDGTDADATNAGINTAIRKAKREGYDVVKFTKGDYLLANDRIGDGLGYEHQAGILPPSFITLDFTEATFHIKPNANPEYVLLRLNMVEEVTLIGGRLVGDRREHDYTTVKHSHEFGCGIVINGSKNILIRDMVIEQMTGDAILIGASHGGVDDRHRSRDIRVTNCEMAHNRRQGISITHAWYVEIDNSYIHDIGVTEDGIAGTAPCCGIDIEPSGGTGWNELTSFVNIHHNTIRHTQAEGLCIVNRWSTDIEAADNLFDDSGIVINRHSARIRLVRNTLNQWHSYMMALKETVDVYMPLEGPNANVMEFQRAGNCSIQTGYIKETDNYRKCD